MTSIADPDGRTTDYGYETTRHKLIGQSRGTLSNAWTYGMAGLLASITNGTDTTNVRSALLSGLEALEVAPELGTINIAFGRKTTLLSNWKGRTLQLWNPDGSTIKYVRDAEGRVTSATDELNRVTSYERDSLGSRLGNDLRNAFEQRGRRSADGTSGHAA